MTARPLDPRRLDVAAFTEEARSLEGDFALSTLQRLAACECPAPEVTDQAGQPMAALEGSPASARHVHWRAEGMQVPAAGLPPQVWLGLQADTTVVLQCQRCLQALASRVRVDRRFRFVADEAAAAALDEQIDDEVLVLTPALDLRDLLEDELLLALPLVPRHDRCPEPLPTSFGEDELPEDEAAHPFAKLAILRKDTEGDGGPDIG